MFCYLLIVRKTLSFVTQKYVFLVLNQIKRDLKLFISHTLVSDTNKNSQHLLVRNQCLTPYHIKINLITNKHTLRFVYLLLRKKNNFLSQTSIVLCSVRKINDEIT